jgi:hypothetical protein
MKSDLFGERSERKQQSYRESLYSLTEWYVVINRMLKEIGMLRLFCDISGGNEELIIWNWSKMGNLRGLREYNRGELVQSMNYHNETLLYS